MTLPPLSLYAHLPWCVRKCPYCDFNSHAAGQRADKRRYIDALLADLAAESARAAGRVVETVFFGGGTPSFFSAAEIGEIVAEIGRVLRLSGNAEITMEANPGTVEHDRLRAYRDAGINRLSLGAQSFNDGSLARLGRIHGASEILNAWCDAERAGFDSINLDLMFALPGQTLEMALEDVRQAILLSPQHLSWYQLTLEPNTVFHAKPPADLPDEELSWAIETEGSELLRAAGYERYETSAHARPGARCRHNLNYWQFGDYLAIGAGAHGKITDEGGAIWRYRKPAHPLSYMQESESGRCDGMREQLAPADIAFEYMLNALRLTDGFTEESFSARTGLPWRFVAPCVQRAAALGLMESAPDSQWAPSAHGRRFLNDLQAMFLPEPPVYSQRPA
ncbi:MAG TPA: radical SAM family heme chaperone HemW [Woeseiaceae bacterium]|nr:radical SAM family heme chaperone HemW [Woeseiaceae bacterium]